MALNIFRHHGLDVTPRSMRTLISGDDAVIFFALQEVFQRAAKESRVDGHHFLECLSGVQIRGRTARNPQKGFGRKAK